MTTDPTKPTVQEADVAALTKLPAVPATEAEAQEILDEIVDALTANKAMGVGAASTVFRLVTLTHPTYAGVEYQLTHALAEVARLASALERAQADTARLEWMLTETANVLKGEPPPDTQHLWHDLPDRAREAAADAARLRWLDLMAVQCDEDAIGQAFYDLSSVQLNDRMRGAWATSLRAAIDAAMSRASSAT